MTSRKSSTRCSGSSIIPGSVTGNIVGGQYTFNAAGGADVGKFSGSITVGAPLVVTGGLPTTVNRSQPTAPQLDRRQRN